MKTPINSRTLKQHLTYSWWKYLLVAVLAFGLVDLLYSVTAYRSPADKRVEFYVYGQMDQEKLTAYMENIRKTEMEDMEVMTPLQLLDDGYYGSMQLMTYMAVGEGDVYLLPRDEFVTGASGGEPSLRHSAEQASRPQPLCKSNGWISLCDCKRRERCERAEVPAHSLPGYVKRIREAFCLP